MSTIKKGPSKAEVEFNATVNSVIATATPEDHQTASAILSPKGDPRLVTITPQIAAVMFTKYNGKNRSLSFGRVGEYVDAMKRGEWKVNHQGLAAYPDGTLADGQHRCAAIAVSGIPSDMMVFPNFDKDAIDTIDRSTRRSAGEALEMMGVENGKLKAGISKVIMAYMAEEAGTKAKFSDQQIEAYVLDKNGVLDQAIAVGESSVDNVTDPAMNKTEAQRIALLMLEGGWQEQLVAGFIASIQQGVATYPEAPTICLSKAYMKAKLSQNRKDNLTTKQKLALALKGASLWVEHKSVSRLVWNGKKEALPTHVAPELETAEAA